MNRKDSGRVRREEESRSPKKPCPDVATLREATSTGQVRAQGGLPMPPNPVFGVTPSSISEANRNLGAIVAKLLEQNYMILNEIKQNMSLMKVQENAQLLSRFRDNLVCMMEHMQSMKGVIGQIPNLPTQLNNELADKSLPKAGQKAAGLFPPFIPVPPMGFPMPPTALPPLPFNGFFPMPIAGLLPGAMPMRVPQMNMMPGPNGLPVNPNMQTVGLVTSLAGMMAGTQHYGCAPSHPMVKGGQGMDGAEVLIQRGTPQLPCSTAMPPGRPINQLPDTGLVAPAPTPTSTNPQRVDEVQNTIQSSGRGMAVEPGLGTDQENMEVRNGPTRHSDERTDMSLHPQMPEKPGSVATAGNKAS